MCSISAYIGTISQAGIKVAESLEKMTYRGYDSAGISVWNKNSVFTDKIIGTDFEKLNIPNSKIGIGQTRWATHGKNNIINTNPQTSGVEVASVMNGTISNYKHIREKLESDGYVFVSDNDTELVSHLAHFFKGNIRSVAKLLEGRYSCIVLYHGRISCIRNGPSLTIGKASNEMYIASDIIAFASNADLAHHLSNNSYAYVDKDGCRIYDIDHGVYSNPIYEKIAYEVSEPQALGALSNTEAEFLESERILQNPIVCNISSNKFLFTGSGSSYHIALLAEHLINGNNIQARAFPACEYQSYYDQMNEDVVLVAISQSGETGDVLRAVESGGMCPVTAITNNTHSALASLATNVIDMDCGREFGVAATKSFMSQAKIIMTLAGVKHTCGEIPNETSFSDEIVNTICGATDIYVLGSGIHYISALESALKMKELLYIHTEAMFAGEFKHGPLAVLEPNTVVIVIDPYEELYDAVSEIMARGGIVIVVSGDLDYKCDYHIKIDTSGLPHDVFIREVLVLQLLAIKSAIAANNNIDRPRHLAKSVTV